MVLIRIYREKEILMTTAQEAAISKIVKVLNNRPV
jgi:hypothetical protein